MSSANGVDQELAAVANDNLTISGEDDGILTQAAAATPRRHNLRAEHTVALPPAPDHSSFVIGFCEDRNVRRRRRMEDAHAMLYDFNDIPNQGYFAIFDGHGGRQVAAWCSENLHTMFGDLLKSQPERPAPEILDELFVQADSFLDSSNGFYAGCTAIVAFIRPEISHTGQQQMVLYTANVGDARAVLCRNGKAERLSYDHKASDPAEKRRIHEARGIVIHDRVNGMLAVSRAFGDSAMKPIVSARPYTVETTLRQEDSFLILACDGLFDVVDDQDACDFVMNEPDPQIAAEKLTKHAISKYSLDNISILIVRFRNLG